ncbi:hypothetical protein [Polaromonas sp. YR568]|uniref:hypothetical protein n=1 Tax=Polaromonas sp. YR568 TaxID=1855301 RepID=UPI0031381B63
MFSTTNRHLAASVSLAATSRDIASVPPPGGLGEIILMCLEGKLSAPLGPANDANARAHMIEKALLLVLVLKDFMFCLEVVKGW